MMNYFIKLTCLLTLISNFLFSEVNENTSTPNIIINESIESTSPHIFICFGGTGDLAKRKLIPALISLAAKKELPTQFIFLGIGRNVKTDVVYREEIYQALTQLSPSALKDWEILKDRIFYFQGDVDKASDFERLNTYLTQIDAQYGTGGNRLFYLSIASNFFPIAIKHLQQHSLIYDNAQETKKWSRVIIEKPFGQDTHSAIELEANIATHIADSQIYRIDHYLGKKGILDLMHFRFTQHVVDSILNNQYVQEVTFTMNEDIGIGTRGVVFESAGLLRDIVQNHMMQLVSLALMDLPSHSSTQEIHREKIKLLEAIRPFSAQIENEVKRGQYGPGIINGENVLGYRQEHNVNPNSAVETYVEATLHIDNPRWCGVPVRLIAGKRMPKKVIEVVIKFKENVEHPSLGSPQALIFSIQPEEKIYFQYQDGSKKVLFPSALEQTKKPVPEAYEMLLNQSMNGNQQQFVNYNELMASWKLWTPVLEYWQKTPPLEFPNYEAGTATLKN